jgi:hypothetical protein
MMGSAKDASKKIRREVKQAVTIQADLLRERLIIEIIHNLYCLPFWQRVKWALKLMRGISISPWDKLEIWMTDKIKRWTNKTDTLSKIGLR